MKCALTRSRVVESPFSSTVNPLAVLLMIRTEPASIVGASVGTTIATDGTGLGSGTEVVVPLLVTVRLVSVTVIVPDTLPTEIGLFAGRVKVDCPAGIRIAVRRPLLPAIGEANATPGLTYPVAGNPGAVLLNDSVSTPSRSSGY